MSVDVSVVDVRSIDRQTSDVRSLERQTSEIAEIRRQSLSAAIEKALTSGDLSALGVQDRVSYYHSVCQSLGLNPLTRPFEYLKLQGKLILYARKDCTDQLRRIHGVSVEIVSREVVDDLYVVVVRATTRDGRRDESIAAVPIKGLSGSEKAGVLMKCESKGKRRVTLSICGLGMSDESETDDIPGSKVVNRLSVADVEYVDNQSKDGERSDDSLSETKTTDIRHPETKNSTPTIEI